MAGNFWWENGVVGGCFIFKLSIKITYMCVYLVLFIPIRTFTGKHLYSGYYKRLNWNNLRNKTGEDEHFL